MNHLKSQSRQNSKNKFTVSQGNLNQSEELNQLNEEGPNEIDEKKNLQFRKFLNNLWGPVRG